MARVPSTDHQSLVWFSLIGNDVCNGHPGFDHMTKPEDFYTHAVESLRAIDAKVVKGSHVVALALFDGELLYDIMSKHQVRILLYHHVFTCLILVVLNHQHPVGSRYSDIYDFMNCLEENPCWGWLNTNQTVRRQTTQWSNDLNQVYRNISATIKFENFDFIFYSPNWVKLFNGMHTRSLNSTHYYQ
jgi:acyloxyacyl hydrolase